MWAMFKEALEIALDKLVDMRQQEGKKIRRRYSTKDVIYYLVI